MNFLLRNFWWKVLALAIAVGVWWTIASEPDLATVISAPVEYKNYPKDLEISSSIVESIDVETRGPANQLRDLSESRISAIVDFSSVKGPGERTFTLTPNELKLPRGITLIRTIPTQLRFHFENRARRNIAVEVPTSGVLPHGLVLSRIDVEPKELEIVGPESRVANAKRAVTDPVELSQIKGDSQQALSVYIGEAEVRFAGTPRVTVKIHVERTR